MSIRRADGVLYVKGALEACCRCAPRGTAGRASRPTRSWRRAACACWRSPWATASEERDLELLGLVGIADPPRTEAIEAVAAARAAGIRTVMITGDHPVTAHGHRARAGHPAAGRGRRRARCTRAPRREDKLRIVRDWKARGEVVAMTGDGVNDAPALREAHIGIAMGKTGTEVTREASDMVLADDNFASIVAAVREGRGIFDNIRKTLVYLLAGNAGELALMLGAALLGLPLPLLPLQLLWINLVTDGLPALALVTDPVESGRDAPAAAAPGRADARARRSGARSLGTAALEAGGHARRVRLGARAHGLHAARSLAFSVLVFAELFRAFAARSRTRIFWEVGAFTNLRLLGVVGLQVLLQLAIQYLPATQALFRIGGLSLARQRARRAARARAGHRARDLEAAAPSTARVQADAGSARLLHHAPCHRARRGLRCLREPGSPGSHARRCRAPARANRRSAAARVSASWIIVAIAVAPPCSQSTSPAQCSRP